VAPRQSVPALERSSTELEGTEVHRREDDTEATDAVHPPRTFVDRVVVTSDGEIAVRTYPGRRGELVLLHGRGANLTSWTRVIRHLPRDLGITALDLRGHGQSMFLERPATWADHASDLGSVCAELGLRRPLLCGHSLGARVAERYAAGGGTCAGLVLLEGMFRVSGGVSARSAAFEEASAGPIAQSCSIRKLAKLAAFSAKALTPEELLNVYLRSGKVVDQTWHRRPDYGDRVLQEQGLLDDWPDDTDQYNRFYEKLRAVPMIVAVWGDRSVYRRRADAADLENLPLPAGVFSELVLFGAGHFLQYEVPSAVAVTINQAVASTGPIPDSAEVPKTSAN